MTTNPTREKHLSYDQRAARCKCLSPERLGFISAALLFSEDFSDGAFYAHLDDVGIDVSELEPFTDGHKCKE